MAKISTYARDTSISGEDLLTGSNYVGVNNYQTNNFKIKDLTQYIQGQISVSPQNTTLKANGGIVVEVINSTDSLAVDLSATNITGQLANSDLANSSITINGTEVSLGGTITIGEVTEVTAGTYLNGGGTEGSVTVNHDLTTRTDTTSTASPSYGDSFTVVDELTTNSTGHVSAANVKTITLPASDDTTYTIEAIASTNDSIIRLVGSDSTTDDVKLIAGSNITLSTSEANDTITISSQAFGNVYTVNSEAAMIAATSQAGDLVVRTDVSKTFIHNGGTAGTAADFTELQFSGINNIALTAGNGITLSRTSITNTDNDLTITNALATSTTQGGIELFSDTEQTVAANAVTAEAGRTYGIQLNSDDQAVVNVPWVNTNTQNTTTLSFVDSGDDIILRNTTGGAGSGDQDINVVAGSNITLTHTDANNIEIASTDTNTFRTVEVDTNGDDSVNKTLGAAETLRFKKGTNITLEESNGIITISSTDTNTEYSAGSGLDLTDTTFSHTDTSSAANLTATARTYVSGLTFDTYGHVTAYTTATETVTDTTRTDEEIRDVAAAQWVDGTNTEVVVDDDNDTIKINATDTNTTDWNFKVDTGTATNIAAGNTLTFTSGTNVTLAQTGNTIDISSTDTNTQRTNEDIRDVAVAMLTAGTNITLTEDDTANTLTIDATDTNTNTQNTYSISIPASTTKFRLTGAGHDGATTDDIEFVGSGTTTVTRTSGSKFTISSTDTNTDTNYYLDGITKAGNTLTFSVNGATNQTYTFGSNAFNSTAYLTAEADTLGDVTGRGASTSTASTFSGGLTASGLFTSSGTGANAYSYFTGNAATTSPAATFTHGLALAWNNSGGSREFEHWWATGADIGNNTAGKNANRTSYMSWFNRFCPTGGTTVDTRMAKWYGSGEFELLDMTGLPGGGATPTFSTPYIRLPLVAGNSGQVLSRKSGSTRDTEWTTPFSGSYDDLSDKPTIPTNNNQLTNGAGYITSFDITTQTDPKYLRSNADDTSSGSLTVVSYKFNGNATNPTGTTATIYDQASVGLTASAHNFSIRNYNGSSMVESARFTTSSLTVIGDVVAFGTPSDVSFKENIKPIENALDKVEKLQGVTFDWKESDSILDIKQDIGFIAQDVQKVLPELVRENDNGKLSLRHQGIISVLTEAIKELSDRVKALEDGSTN